MISDVKIGDKAPDFSLLDMKKRVRSLNEFLGQNVILIFFVGAFISSCTKERCEFRDSMSRLINLKAQIVGIDVNLPYSNRIRSEKTRLPFPILSDNKREVIHAYGLDCADLGGKKEGSITCCWGDGCYPIAKRSLFVLDKNGIVRFAWTSVSGSDEPDYTEIEKILNYSPLQYQTVTTTPRTVITISRQFGSGGDEVAFEVSKILGFDYFDKSLLISEARKIGVNDEEIADFSEDNYKIRSIIDNILLREKPPCMSGTVKTGELNGKMLDVKDCLSVIQTVVNNIAMRGKTVIVGRGGQAILRDKEGVLHVRIIAPIESRVDRIMKIKGLDQKSALKLIEENDKATAEYMHRFYGVDWEDPANYDIVLNTKRMDLSTASKLIVSVASKGKYEFKREIEEINS